MTVRGINVNKLELFEHEQFAANLEGKLSQHIVGNSGAEKEWAAFRDLVYSTAFAHLGQNSCKYQDWFDENDGEIQKLLNEKWELHRIYQQDSSSTSKKAAFNSLKSKVQAKLREMQDSWLSKKADEIQFYDDSNNPKHFYNSLKAIYGPKTYGVSLLLSADGATLISDKDMILERWAEHFHSVLNRPSSINAEAIDHLPQVEVNPSLAELPTEEEVLRAIRLLSCGKTPGADSIPADIYKVGGPLLTQKLTEIFQIIWQEEIIPPGVQGCLHCPSL